jgi:hypothetical protein
LMPEMLCSYRKVKNSIGSDGLAAALKMPA